MCFPVTPPVGAVAVHRLSPDLAVEAWARGPLAGLDTEIRDSPESPPKPLLGEERGGRRREQFVQRPSLEGRNRAAAKAEAVDVADGLLDYIESAHSSSSPALDSARGFIFEFSDGDSSWSEEDGEDRDLDSRGGKEHAVLQSKADGLPGRGSESAVEAALEVVKLSQRFADAASEALLPPAAARGMPAAELARCLQAHWGLGRWMGHALGLAAVESGRVEAQ